MSIKRALFIGLIVSGVMLTAGISSRPTGSALALPPAQEADPEGITIPYPGRLDDETGQPVADGAYDFAFALYGVETGGEPLWSEVQEGVAVQGGTFTALLGSVASIPKEALAGDARWLAVRVRGPGEADFTDLAPRQALSAAAPMSPASPAAPAAGPACAHDHFEEKWSGGSSSSTGLEVQAGGTAILGINAVWDGTPRAGVKGEGLYYGVWGDSEDVGVYGESAFGNGVHGQGANFGVVAEGNDTSATDALGDLRLAGTRGEILHSGQYLNIYSDFHIRLDLDHDNDQSGAHFVVLNGQDQVAMQLEENGDLAIGGSLTKSGGGFRIDHPLDPGGQYLHHSFVESPDMMNIYNGNVTLDGNGEAWVELPDWFEALNGGEENRSDFRYQLTCIGGFAPVYIAREIEDNRFQIAGGTPGLKVSWQVTGIRHDPYAEANRIPVEEKKPLEEQGTYLHPVEYGNPEALSATYREEIHAKQPGDGGGR